MYDNRVKTVQIRCVQVIVVPWLHWEYGNCPIRGCHVLLRAQLEEVHDSWSVGTCSSHARTGC